jgi:hypothetical protein
MGSRLFGYNSGATVSGASQSGNLAVSNDSRGGGSVQWWNGPDEDLGYVIGYTDTTGLRKANGTLIGGNAVGFIRTLTKTDAEFLSLSNSLTGQGFMTASVAVNWLNTNGYYTSYSVDTDAQAFITAAGITDSTQKTAINTLVVGLKADGIWTKMQAIYPFVGGSASTHKWNLKDPRDLNAAYRLTFNGGWTHNSNGITGNGTNAYAESYYFPITINTIGTYNRTAIINNQSLLGSAFTGIDNDGYQTNPIGLVLRNNSVSPGYNGTLFSAGTPAPAAITVSRTSADGATAIKVYRNGTQNSTGDNSEWQLLVTSGALVSSMIIGATRQDDYDYDGFLIGTNYYSYSTANIAFAFMGDIALTGTEVTNLNTRIQAFQTTLGRQV